MKFTITLIALLFFNLNLYSQVEKISKTRFVIGLWAPELLHAGITHRIAGASQFGLSLGAGPSWGIIWT